MNELRDLGLLVLALFSSVSVLLYVLAVIDPQTDRTPQRSSPTRATLGG